LCPKECPEGKAVTVQFGSNMKQHPQIVPIFWEDQGVNQWSKGTAKPSMGSLLGQLLTLVNNPWWAAWNQYATVNGFTGMIGHPRISTVTPVYATQKGLTNADGSAATTSHFDTTAIEQIIYYEQQNLYVPRSLPVPSDDDVVYVVLVPNNQTATDCGSNGCNWSFGSYNGANRNADYSGNRPPIAFVNNVDNFTLSHELAEAIVSVGQGVALNGCQTDSKGQEINLGISDICDACYNQTSGWTPVSQYNGLAVQPYWSPADNQCVIPDKWGNLEISQGAGWSQTTLIPRQMAGGGGGLVVTSQHNVPYWVTSATSFVEMSTSIAGSEWAAGGTWVAGLGLDTSQSIHAWSTSTQSWAGSFPAVPTRAGYPNPMPLTGIYVTSGSNIVVTDAVGDVWAYDPFAGGVWNDLHVGCTEVAAQDANLLCVGMNRNQMWSYPGSNFAVSSAVWNFIGQLNFNVMGIVATSEPASSWAVIKEGTDTLWEQGNIQVGSGNGGVEWAISPDAADEEFTFLSHPGRNSYAEYRLRGAWQQVHLGGAMGRLVSGNYGYGTICNGTGANGCFFY
jgi:hypothetical protein